MIQISAREFNQDVSAAKRHASKRPVIITDRGKPAYVLLSIDEYRRLSQNEVSLVDRLSMDEDLNIDFEPLKIDLKDPGL
ncbi:MAG: type II toxin-antitoxin system Phd/YefM family antitoxin [Actinomycetaceae bacterium]|nr:type II toxin-antitoxin system Phd/YefM family antitoxin [Actinomycetaceae bacterium]